MRILFKLPVDLKGRLQQIRVVREGDVGHAARQVEADPLEHLLVHELLEEGQLLDLHEEVARLGLGVVLDLKGNDLANKSCSKKSFRNLTFFASKEITIFVCFAGCDFQWSW